MKTAAKKRVAKDVVVEAGADERVDAFLESEPQWKAEIERLRKILLGCGLEEGWKWGKPSYMRHGKNVAVLVSMKESVALLFMKGGLLKDPEGVLTRQGEHTEVGRWIKFTAVQQVAKLEPVLKAYLFEAIAAEDAGLKVKTTPVAERKLPEELAAALERSAKLRKAFEALTPGRQKGYAIFIARAKRPETRQAYVEKFVPQILAGKGLDDEARAARKG